MKPYFNLLLTFCFFVVGSRVAAQNTTILQYINTYKFAAIEEMKRTGVPASIKLAQGILETQAGQSDLVRRSNNHFGIKCKTAWAGEKVYHDDDERGECFRAYGTAMDSYKDHSDFLKNSQRYSFLFKINPEDYKEWARGLKKAGYATNPKYWQQLVKYIEDYSLNFYTQIALGKQQMADELPMYASVVVDNPQVVAAAIVTTDAGAPGNGAIEVIAMELPVQQYPEGVFEINSTRVITARAGSSLLALAEEHDLRFKQLLDFNDLPQDIDLLQKDQLVFLQRKRKHGANDFTVLYKNETLYDVSQREGIRLDDLLEYNFLEKTQQPAAGRKIFLKKELAAKSLQQNNEVQYQVAQVSNSTGTVANNVDVEKKNTDTHIVQGRETLFGIAKKYQVTVDQIKTWNKLRSDELRTGQQLLIYKN